MLMFLSINIHNQPKNTFTAFSALKRKEKHISLWPMYKTQQEEQHTLSES